MGSGSTIAAASATGLRSIGLEIDPTYFAMATKAIPLLAAYTPKDNGDDGNGADAIYAAS